MNLLVSDLFTGADVEAVAKVYDEKPEDFGNARGTFDDASAYTIYSAVDGVIEVDKEVPGTYYVVLTATGYNTEFLEMVIPDGTNRGDITDYLSAPDNKLADMTQVGTTVSSDIELTLVNDSSADIEEDVDLKVADNTEFRGWKVIVTDAIEFSLDADGDGTYDEGISTFAVSINGEETEIFNPNKAVDEFDSNDQYTIMLDDVVIQDGDKLNVGVVISAVSGDFAGANDEVLGEGDGLIATVKIYDETGSLFATVGVNA